MDHGLVEPLHGLGPDLRRPRSSKTSPPLQRRVPCTALVGRLDRREPVTDLKKLNRLDMFRMLHRSLKEFLNAEISSDKRLSTTIIRDAWIIGNHWTSSL